MSNYKDMYLALANATEQSINLLIQAQRDAEDIYINAPEADVRVLIQPEKEP